MATVILVRHGRSSANTSGVLAGRTDGVELDETGHTQVKAVGERLAAVDLALAVSSPLERCRQTTAAILEHQAREVPWETHEGLNECDYGAWQGHPLKTLAEDPLWRTVQDHPSQVTFPQGESMRTMSARAVEAVRALDARVEAEHGPRAVWLAVSHGDIIKSVLADAYGLHLDHFQRVVVDPASVSIVRFTAARPYVVATNTHGGDLSWLRAPERDAESTDAVPGGGAGPGAAPGPA